VHVQTARRFASQSVELYVSEDAWVAICLDEDGQVRHWMSLTPFAGT
jgi:hypothetical protein